MGDEGLVGRDARGEGFIACGFDENFDLGVKFFAQELGLDGFLCAAGIVGGRMDGESLEERGLFVQVV